MRNCALPPGTKVKVGSKKNGSHSVPSLRLVTCSTGTRVKLPLLKAPDKPCGKHVVLAVRAVVIWPCAATTVDGDDDDVAVADQDAGFETSACTGNERAAMDEDPNGEPVVAVRAGGRRDVEEEAIFTEGRRGRKLIDLLRTRAARRGRIEYRVRAHRSCGRRPTVRTGRRVGVADALELVDYTAA